MTLMLEIFLNPFKCWNSYLDKLIEPNSRFFLSKVEKKISHKRNKTLIILQLVLILIFLLDRAVNNIPTNITALRCLACLMICFVLWVSTKYNPQIFNILYTVICLGYGPCVMNINQEGPHLAWISTLYLPTFVYVFTGSLNYTLFQTVFQILYANTIYKERMKIAIVFMSPDNFEKALIQSANSAIIFHLVLILFTHIMMQYAYKTISRAEEKKDEAERHKNFLLGFSHELRNLINSLTGNVKLASLENLVPKAKELLLNAEVCGELLLHLINNILDTGKVEIGELEINPVPTEIFDTLERIWGVCSELIKRKNLSGVLTIPKNLPRNLIIDHYRLTQIFLNLVGNAVKFTDKGSIDITVNWINNEEIVSENCFKPYPFNNSDEYDEGLFEKSKMMNRFDSNIVKMDLFSRKIDKNLLKPSIDTQKGVLKVTVTDTGCGISEKEMEKLFQKFSQVSSDASKRKLGTGLGLFITKELCQKMQGQIRAFSKNDQGTCFIFCIPTSVIREESIHLRDSDSIRQFVHSQNLKAMIVDDQAFNHAVLGNFFEKLGIEVVNIASNGEEAYQNYFQLIQEGKHPHIITMDLDMPIMDGKEASQKIRKLEIENNLNPCCLVIISGNCSESEIGECINQYGEIKADAFIKKPATIEEILRVTAHHFISSKSKKESFL